MKDERGITLVELLITITLLGLIILIVFIPITFSMNNFNAQREKSDILSDTGYIMDQLTREIRKAEEVEVGIEGEDKKLLLDDSSIIYELREDNLLKNDKIILEKLKKFNVEKVNKRINIEIAIGDSKGREYNITSTINIR